MAITEEMIISGFISKIISDVVDVPENLIKIAIKDADKKRRDRNQSIETRIYQVTSDAIKEFTKKDYKGQDVLYDAAESIVRGFKNSNNDIEAVRVGLKMLVSQVTSETCEEFLKTLCHVICIDKNDILYRQIILIQGGQTFEAVCEGFDVSNKNDEETHEKLDYVIEGIDNITEKINGTEKREIKHCEIPIKNRADEYAKKWDENVFLNDFNKRDKNAGVNIKLNEIYLEKHLPHYVWKMIDEPLDDLKELLCEYTVDNDDKKMLLILGQAGIGKSTLITWIMANLVEKKDDILVYQFASDLKNIEWHADKILKIVLKTLNLGYKELENKTLILDGFDEIHANSDRERILNTLKQEVEEMNNLNRFSLIITCRENYVYELRKIECDFITLQTWDDAQIKSFCEMYEKKSIGTISGTKIDRILDNKEVFGIPLILYMVLALDITIEKSASLVDVYDQIFSLDRSSIYDRCIENARYGKDHRISEYRIKQQIHQISKGIAFWIFENNSEKAFINSKEYEEICDNVIGENSDENTKKDFLIGNYFKLLKHCEGIGTQELHFIHRSIYEYFVVVYFFESLHNLTSKEEVAGKLGELLKDGHLSEQILEFIKCKFDNLTNYNFSNNAREVFNIMLHNGMTYYTKKQYKNVVEKEMNIFFNMLEIVRLWNSALGEFDNEIIMYLRCNIRSKLNLKGIKLCGACLCNTYFAEANFERADFGETIDDETFFESKMVRKTSLKGADLREANLRKVNLIGADLERVDLKGADLGGGHLEGAYLERADLKGANLKRVHLERAYLERADLKGANFGGGHLEGADLRWADLKGIGLKRAHLEGTIFDETQVDLLYEKFDLSNCNVYIFETNMTVNYKEYCIKKYIK